MQQPESLQQPKESLLSFGCPTGIYVPESAAAKSSTVPTNDATTNVVLVSLGGLARIDGAVATGDPTCCANCKAAFNLYSRLSPAPSATDTIWKCEFCGQENDVDLEPEEIPRDDVLDYFVGEVPAEDEQAVEAQQRGDDSLLIFIIDTSGSMSSTTQVDAAKWNGEDASAAAPKKAPAASSLLSFRGGARQQQQQQPQEKWVSRLEFVQRAVDTQLDVLKAQSPNRRVGLITFSNGVIVYDDQGQPQHIEGDVLDEYSALVERSSTFPLNTPISKNRDQLGAVVRGLEDGGMTALGPALLLGVGMAAQKPGSKCIVCTDGLANVGVGTLEETKTDFYEQVGQFAKRKGVVLSVISIKGTETRLEELGKIADLTRGSVDLVDPDNLSFASIIASRTLATNCSVSLFMHQSLRLRYITPTATDTSTTTSTLHKHSQDVGNVTPTTQIAFEFDAVSNTTGATALPFQLQVSFTRLNGTERRRIHTIMMPITSDANKAKAALDICVISANLAQQCAQLAKAGKYQEALEKAHGVRDMIQEHVKTAEQQRLFDIFMRELHSITAELQKTIARESELCSNAESMDADERSALRLDSTARDLYSYKSANAAACLLQ